MVWQTREMWEIWDQNHVAGGAACPPPHTLGVAGTLGTRHRKSLTWRPTYHDRHFKHFFVLILLIYPSSITVVQQTPEIIKLTSRFVDHLARKPGAKKLQFFELVCNLCGIN